MELAERFTQLQAVAKTLNDLIAFADAEEDFVLGATLDAARVRLNDRYPQTKI